MTSTKPTLEIGSLQRVIEKFRRRFGVGSLDFALGGITATSWFHRGLDLGILIVDAAARF